MLIVTKPSTELTLPASLKQVTGVLVTGAFRHIRAQLDELEACARETAMMEDELDRFLESYYARVLPLTARLERLRYRKTHGIFPPQHIMGELFAPRSKQGSPIAKRKKELFRSLVKRCHPDNRQKNPSTIDISQVYAAKTVSALWQLEIISVCDTLASHAEVNLYLAGQQTESENAYWESRRYNDSFAQSDMWQLKEHIYEAALEGEDLIEQIQSRIEKQIAALQQYFAKPRNFEAVT